eukprot:6283953-Prymnesium_polylepis.1
MAIVKIPTDRAFRDQTTEQLGAQTTPEQRRACELTGAQTCSIRLLGRGFVRPFANASKHARPCGVVPHSSSAVLLLAPLNVGSAPYSSSIERDWECPPCAAVMRADVLPAAPLASAPRSKSTAKQSALRGQRARQVKCCVDV